MGKNFYSVCLLLVLSATAILVDGCVQGEIQKSKAVPVKSLTPGKILASHNLSLFNIKPFPDTFVSPADMIPPYNNQAGPYTSTFPAFQIVIGVENALEEHFINRWYLDGVLDHQDVDQVTPFDMNPADDVRFPKGTHIVKSDLIDPALGTLLSRAVWIFTMGDSSTSPLFNGFNLPSSHQGTLIGPFYNNGGQVQILPNGTPTVLNPSHVPFYVDWFLDGILQTTFNNLSGSFTIDPSDVGDFPVGDHVVKVVLRNSGIPTEETYDSMFWRFTIINAAIDIVPAQVVPQPVPKTLVGSTLTIDTPIDIISGVSLANNGDLLRPVPADDATRGTPFSDYCVGLTSGKGAYGGTIKLVFYKGSVLSANKISEEYSVSALTFAGIDNPAAVCLSGAGNVNVLADPLTSPTLRLSGPTPEVTSIIAVAYDNALNAEIGRVVWSDVILQPANTKPVLTVDTTAGKLDLTSSVVQGTPFTLGFTIKDKDSSDSPVIGTDYSMSFELSTDNGVNWSGGNNGLLDGATQGLWIGSNVTSPNCSRSTTDLGDRETCTLTLPSYNSTSTIPAGTYKIRAKVTDNTTHGQSGLDSDFITWTLTVTKSNSAPTFANLQDPGFGASSTSWLTTAQTYIYNTGPSVASDNTTAIGTATEGDTIYFNLNVADPDRDDFKVEIYQETIDTGVRSGPTIVNALTVDPVANNTAFNTKLVSIAYTIPRSVIKGGPTDPTTANLIFRVKVTDLPSSGTSLSVTHDFVLTVTNDSPPPTISAPTISPPLSTAAKVLAGFPYTFSVVGGITNNSDPADPTVTKYQWEDRITLDGSCTDGIYTWDAISGATTTKLITSPSLTAANVPEKLCFRMCIGDNGVGNDVASCAHFVGPWDGAGSGAMATITPYENPVYNATDLQADGKIAVWVDPTINTGNLNHYTVAVEGESLSGTAYKLKVLRQDFPQSGNAIAVNQSILTLETNSSSGASDTYPFNISITGNGNYIFIAYQINEVSLAFPMGIPTIRIYRLDNLTLANPLMLKLPVVTSSIGRIISDGAAWYLPFSRGDNLNKIAIAHALDGDTGIANVLDGTTNVVNLNQGDITSAVDNAYDSGGSKIVIALRNSSGNISLYSHSLAGNTPNPAPAASAPNIISSAFGNFRLALGSGSNSHAYLIGVDGANNLTLARRNLTTLADDLSGLVDLGAADPKLVGPEAFDLAPTATNKEFVVGVSKSTEIYMAKFRDTTFVEVTPLVNPLTPATTDTSHTQFTMTPVMGVTMGDSGATALESTQKSVFIDFISTAGGHSVYSELISVVPVPVIYTLPPVPIAVPFFSKP